MSAAEPLPRTAGDIVLRRLAPADVAAFQEYRRDPELARYQGWSAMSDDEARAFLDEMSAIALLRPGTWTQLGIADRVDLALLGDIGLFVAENGRRAEIGFTLRRRSQGRGIATTAVRAALDLLFELTDVEEVIGTVDARNTASIRLLERVGMRRSESRTAVHGGASCTELVFVAARRAAR
ncbi:MAG: GNAT family N-acetyltransferase [Planctomycetes bacterium]|nr:GNAT family N-acetyltransferase [Planctomycetota bacterium]